MSTELVAEITDILRKAVGENSGLGYVLKFDFKGDGFTLIDGKSIPNVVSNADAPADCTITVTAENLKKMAKREMDPTMAYMQGKMKVAGDMSVAMKLGPILQKAAGLI